MQYETVTHYISSIYAFKETNLWIFLELHVDGEPIVRCYGKNQWERDSKLVSTI